MKQIDRSVIEKEILYFIDKFRPGSNNVDIYKSLFARLSDKEFSNWVDKLGVSESLVLYSPFNELPGISMEANYQISEELEYPLFRKLLLTDPETGQVKWTPNKYLVGILPVKRQVQMLVNKSTIPDSNSVVDERSGQASGSSKGSRLSSPEIHVNASKGLRNMVLELIKFRGGDEKAYEAMNESIMQTGEVSMNTIMASNPTQVKANKSMAIYFKAMHIQNNLLG